MQMLEMADFQRDGHLGQIRLGGMGGNIDNIGIVETDGAADFGKDAPFVFRTDMDSDLIGLFGYTGPGNVDPPLGIGTEQVDAIRLMNGNPTAHGDEADDRVAGQGLAALTDLDQHAIDAVNLDAGLALVLPH